MASTWSTSHTLHYAEDDEDAALERRHSAEIASSIHTEGMTPRSRRQASEDKDVMRAALLDGQVSNPNPNPNQLSNPNPNPDPSQVRFPPNGWWADGWFYVKNNHVFLSIFLAHPSHPYTRGRRFLVLLNSLPFA